MKVIVDRIPNSMEEYKNLLINDLAIPQNTIAMFLVALEVFVRDKELGVEMINYIKGPVSLSNHDISFLKDRVIDKPYLPRAYYDGAAPENEYTPDRPITLSVWDNNTVYVEEGYLKLLVQTKGSDSKRSVTLRNKDNKWYMWDYSAVVTGIRKPASEASW